MRKEREEGVVVASLAAVHAGARRGGTPGHAGALELDLPLWLSTEATVESFCSLN